MVDFDLNTNLESCNNFNENSNSLELVPKKGIFLEKSSNNNNRFKKLGKQIKFAVSLSAPNTPMQTRNNFIRKV